MNHYILSAIWLSLFMLVIYSFIGARLRGYKNLNTAEAVQLINQQDAVVVDVREDNEFRSEHILNSVHIPLGYFKERVKELEKHKSKPVIIGCKTGQRSSHACALLKKEGFEQVFNLSGGVTAWKADNLPLTTK